MGDEKSVERQASGMWGWFLFTGLLWVLIAFMILRFDLESAMAVGILVGMVLIFAGINEFGAAYVAERWKWVHVLMGILFVVGGIYALIQPGEAFLVLASLVSFFLLIKGTFDIIVSLMEREEVPVWWLLLLAGIIEIVIGFWAAGSGSREIVLLILWVGAMCLIRGITEIVFAFRMHALRNAA
ncbi:MAG: DUF308 domain-containing protein [Actinomycetota bacterium]